jgi:hypothetical protein
LKEVEEKRKVEEKAEMELKEKCVFSSVEKIK